MAIFAVQSFFVCSILVLSAKKGTVIPQRLAHAAKQVNDDFLY